MTFLSEIMLTIFFEALILGVVALSVWLCVCVLGQGMRASGGNPTFGFLPELVSGEPALSVHLWVDTLGHK